MCTPSFMQGSFQGQETGAPARTPARPGSLCRRAPIEDLRRTIDCLPLRTREAMLEGIREQRHHRRRLPDRAAASARCSPPTAAAGARASSPSPGPGTASPPRAARAGRPPASCGVLERNLEESIAAEHGPAATSAPAIADHQASRARPQGRRGRPRGQRLGFAQRRSAGRMNWISGMTQPGESFSSARTISATSDGRDHLLGRDLTLDEVGHRRVDEAPGTARST